MLKNQFSKCVLPIGLMGSLAIFSQALGAQEPLQIPAEFAQDYSIFAIEDIVSLQKSTEADSYDVVCSSGVFERISELDLRINNVCPHIEISSNAKILSMQRMSDGNFRLICQDLTRVVASADEIRMGRVCLGEAPPLVPILKAGSFSYQGSESWFCTSQTITPTYDPSNQVLSQVTLKTGGDCSSSSAVLPCSANRCEGSVPWDSTGRFVEVIDATNYVYGVSNSTRRGEYKWQLEE